MAVGRKTMKLLKYGNRYGFTNVEQQIQLIFFSAVMMAYSFVGFVNF
jgi:hypothetical protein